MIAYAISSPETLHFDQRLPSDLERFAKQADWLLYRDKDTPYYAKNARRLAEALRDFPQLKLLIHDDWRLALDRDVYGVHFSARRSVELEAAKASGVLQCIVSTHSIEEAASASERGADGVTLSPVFPSPGKGKPLGAEYLSRAIDELSIPVIALGGIVDAARIEKVHAAGAFGFASIRYFA